MPEAVRDDRNGGFTPTFLFIIFSRNAMFFELGDNRCHGETTCIRTYPYFEIITVFTQRVWIETACFYRYSPRRTDLVNRNRTSSNDQNKLSERSEKVKTPRKYVPNKCS